MRSMRSVRNPILLCCYSGGTRPKMTVNPATPKPGMVTQCFWDSFRVPTGVVSPYTGRMVQQNEDQAVHEAARAGLTDTLAEMLAMDTSLIDAKGVDARTPLHCAGTVAVAALLLDH